MLQLGAHGSIFHMQVVIGVDGCERGWVFVRLENGEFTPAVVYEHFAAGVGASGDATVIAVDIPIGYPAHPAQQRAADPAARAMVGPLRSSVFPTPHPGVLAAPDWPAANALSRELTGRGLSKQSYALIPKILEVGLIAGQDERVYEVHPEVSFRAPAGHALASKKQWNGHAGRRALLAAAGIVIPDALGDAGTAAADDILDAAVAAWSASRIAAGVAVSLPAPPEPGEDGRQIAIWY